MAVTPVAGTNVAVASSDTPVPVIPANAAGGIITNPLSATDQGIGAAEPLYINPVTDPTLQGNGTTFALAPGQSWEVIPGQTTVTKANAATAGHKFTAIYW
jgi:hypothetical protein